MRLSYRPQVELAKSQTLSGGAASRIPLCCVREERRLRRMNNTPRACLMADLSAGIVADDALMVDQGSCSVLTYTLFNDKNNRIELGAISSAG